MPAVETWTTGVRLDLPGSLTLDDIDALLDKLREYGFASPMLDGKSIGIQLRAEDEWNLRGAVEEMVSEVEANNPAIAFPERDDDTVWRRWQGEAEPFA